MRWRVSNWGEVVSADRVIEPLIWDDGDWGARAAARFRLLHGQYPKHFRHTDRDWIEAVLAKHGSEYTAIYTQAILYAVAHHDCALARRLDS